MIWLLFVILILYIIADILYRRTARYKNKFEDMKKINCYRNTNIDFINIGSTQARYAYEYMNVKGLNAATNEQSLEYSFLMLKKYLPYLNKGGKIIISVSDMDLLLSADLQERKYKYFGILPIGKISFVKNILLPLLFAPKEIKYIFKDEGLYSKFEIDKNILNENEKYKDCERRIERWKKYGVISFNSESGFVIDNKNNNINRNIELIRNVIEFCCEKGYYIVLVTPPVSPYFNSYFGNGFKDVLIKPLTELAKSENIKYFDFSNDKRFCDEDLYLNTDCLNKNGRKVFMDILVKTLI